MIILIRALDLIINPVVGGIPAALNILNFILLTPLFICLLIVFLDFFFISVKIVYRMAEYKIRYNTATQLAHAIDISTHLIWIRDEDIIKGLINVTDIRYIVIITIDKAIAFAIMTFHLIFIKSAMGIIFCHVIKM